MEKVQCSQTKELSNTNSDWGEIKINQNSLCNTENLNSSPKKRRRRDSFLEAKTKIHELLRKKMCYRIHRYDVRAADEKAVKMEQRLTRLNYDAIIHTSVHRTMCR
ncbi:unnamed protein product [Thelazia callipaeda]|uniref:Uncharacterized protein n=1 Tax=Thelazia callipaeda TaxID=103827 RepID=A0A0N5CRX8_THECL|nr:unnamed protein product [Thelazia callipaeda]